MPPVGFKRSRALWNDARRPRERKLDQWKSFFRAIAYELQPVRFSEQSIDMAAIWSKVFIFSKQVFKCIVHGALPYLVSFLRHMTWRQWLMAAGVVAYYWVIRWIHEMLHAGPMFLMISALFLIFTFGLGERQDGELSAYSVFNRGFQRLMGSVDVDELVNQHVGGAAMVMGDGVENDVPVNNIRNHRRVGRQAEQQQQQTNNENDNNHDAIDSDSDENQNDAQRAQQQARKSGKKARRRNLEERREHQRQREAARAMGLDGTGGQEEMMAMQRLLEEQIAMAHNNQ